MIYADSGFFVALNTPQDTFFTPAVRFYEANQTSVWLWSPWHSVEVFNTIRQLTRHLETRRRLRAPEAKAIIRGLEEDVRIGYFTHMEADWRDVLRTANEISLTCATSRPCRSADLLHVAYAIELTAQLFVSYDEDQIVLAKAAGLKTARPV